MINETHLDGRLRIINGHALDALARLPDGSVDAVITSPPYFGLRSYATEPQVWDGDPSCVHDFANKIPGDNRGGSGTPTDKNNRGEGYARASPKGRFCVKCQAWCGELGGEPSVALYVKHLTTVFAEVRRVLKDTGIAFVVVGDTYNGKPPWGRGGGRALIGGKPKFRPGSLRADGIVKQDAPRNRDGYNDPCLKPKDMCLVPFRFAISLQESGWWVRSTIIWNKVNQIPNSQGDRPTTDFEYVFMLCKSVRYFYDDFAVREPAKTGWNGNSFTDPRDKIIKPSLGKGPRTEDMKWRTRRSVWAINTVPSKHCHYAAFPPELVKICLLAGTSEAGACPSCGKPWKRIVEKKRCVDGIPRDDMGGWIKSCDGNPETAQGFGHWRITSEQKHLGWEPTCSCKWYRLKFNLPESAFNMIQQSIMNLKSAGSLIFHEDKIPVELLSCFELVPKQEFPIRPSVIADPFAGSGTTGKVALDLGRSAILVELAGHYIPIIREKCGVANSG